MDSEFWLMNQEESESLFYFFLFRVLKKNLESQLIRLLRAELSAEAQFEENYKTIILFAFLTSRFTPCTLDQNNISHD